MGTVGKAISLLELFTINEPELGLSDLARRSGFDKATTRRLLVSLAGHGMVEQDAATRLYRLGGGVSRLARIREARFPFAQTAIPVLRELGAATSETVHASEFSALGLATVHVEFPARANRVNVDVGAVLPLHSTASGIAFMAFARDEMVRSYLAGPLPAFTPHTVTDPAALMKAVAAARIRGHSVGDQGFEDGVYSVAAAILGPDGYAVGAVAVAAPVARTTEPLSAERGHAAIAAARQISTRLYGENIEPQRKQAS